MMRASSGSFGYAQDDEFVGVAEESGSDRALSYESAVTMLRRAW
jgi:hypothetical protein